MSLLYAVEAWVLAVVGVAYVTLRDLVPDRPLMEELCGYSTMVVSTVHLLLCTAVKNRMELAKAYLGFTLMVWTYLAYALADGIQMYDVYPPYNPRANSSACCPNRDVPGMNRILYFGGLTAFYIPGAVSMAFATVQVLIAGASMVSAQGTIWPGNGWGYGVAAMLSLVYFLRFRGVILKRPCPTQTFDWIPFLHISYTWGFALSTGILVSMIVIDGIALSPSGMMVSRGMGLGAMTIFCVVVWAASKDTGMFTIPLIALLIKALLPPIWGIIEPWLGDSSPAPVPQLSQRPQKVRTRWVMPVDIGFDKAVLPCPIPMGPAPRQKQA